MTSFTDDFNRADNTNLGANWVEVSGDWSIVSNQLSSGNAGGTVILRAAGAMAGNDNYAQMTIAATAAVSHGVWCRGNSNITSGYLWRNDGTSWNLFSVVGGSFTSIASFAAAAAPGDVAKVEAIGTAIKGYVNGVVRASVTDSAVATGTSVGIRSESTSSVKFDDFTGADATSGTNAPAGNAAGTGAAGAPATKVSPVAGVAAGTGSAGTPVAKVAPATAAATGTGTSGAPVANVQPAVSAAAGTGSTPAVSLTISSNVPAGAASGAGAAGTATANIAPALNAAAATGSAGDPRAAVSPVAGAASGVGAAAAPAPNVAPAAGQGAGVGTAGQVSPAVATSPAAAAGTGVAQSPSVTADGTTSAAAGLAAGTGAAGTPTASIKASPGAATGTGSAGAATSGVAPTINTAAGIAAAPTPGTALAVGAGTASGTGTAAAPTVSTSGSSVSAHAGVAQGTGTAHSPTVHAVTTAAPATNGWNSLLGMLRESAGVREDEQFRIPAACPDCGEPLRDAHGIAYCGFDGSEWAAGGRRTYSTPTQRPPPVNDELGQDPVSCLDCGEPLRTGPNGELYCQFDGQIWAAGNRRAGLVGTNHN